MNQFDKQALEVLGLLLPDYSFERKEFDTLYVMKGEVQLRMKIDFEQMFKLIDDDVLRQVDSSDFYWGNLCELIKNEFKKFADEKTN